MDKVKMNKVVENSGFSSELFEKIYPDGVENSFWSWARNHIILRIIKKYRAEPILDIGAGRGVVTCFLHKAGLKIDGVEIGKTNLIPGCSANIKLFSRCFFFAR
jgi:2-polyprenyl-3-methyl-5-hydroxy-6-metoxy-1,4-benzoquinol methylase